MHFQRTETGAFCAPWPTHLQRPPRRHRGPALPPAAVEQQAGRTAGGVTYRLDTPDQEEVKK